MSIYIPILAAVIGAITGILLKLASERARLLVVVDSVLLSNDYPDSLAAVEVDEELMERCVQYGPTLEVLGRQRGQTTEREYTDILKTLKQELTSLQEIELPRGRSYLGDLRSYANSGDWDRFDNLLSKYGAAFAASAATLVLYQKFALPSLESRYEGAGAHSIIDDNDGFIVTVPGPRPIALVVGSGSPATAVHLRPILKDLALLVVHRDKELLSPLIEAILKDFDDKAEIWAGTRQRIDQALAPLARVHIEGIVANNGRSATSLLGKGSLVVKLRGYPSGESVVEDDQEVVMKVSSPADRYSLAIEGNINAVGKLLSSPPSAILAEPGKAVRFRAVSQVPVNRLDFAEDLRRCFAGGDRSGYVSLAASTRRGSKTRVIHSRDFLFRDLQLSTVLARKRRRLPRLTWGD